jgi:hypothetical protein
MSEVQTPVPLCTRVRDNGIAVQALIDRTGLPSPTVVPLVDVVHVMLADVDDLLPWRAELGGTVGAALTPAGLVEWTLRAVLVATRRRGAVQIQVHALAVSGQDVLPSLREAVAS